MDKLRMETPDLTAENVEKIAALFPNCVTEVVDEARSTDETIVYKKGINFAVLKQMLSDAVVDGGEAYEFTWVGKKAAMVEANRPIRKTLRPCPEESKDWDTTENLYIEGDNLEVLKLLQESYLNKVKMIYIDPPYNTGSDKFIYPDVYSMEEDEYNDKIGLFDENGNRLFRENGKSDPCFHSKWCSMIYQRLLLARNLLLPEGLILISIDDNEQENLKKICNEVFGSENFIATFKWNRTAKAPSLSDSVRIKYEYVLCYGKQKIPKLFGKKSYNTEAPLLNVSNKTVSICFPKESIIVSNSFPAGNYSLKYGVDLLTPIESDGGTNINDVVISAKFKWSQSTVDEYLKTQRKFIIKKSPSTIYYQLNNEDSYIPPADVINEEECGVKKNTDASEMLKRMGIPFDYSKPVSLLRYLINATTYQNRDSIILDFFSGSATTAHAVMQLNAEDGGHRKFIMVQLPEVCDEKSEAAKAGYKTICDIGKERIRRAGEKIKAEQGLAAQNLDTGFRVLKLDESNMKDVFYAPEELSQETMYDMVSNIRDGRTGLDLLFGCLLDWGLPLSLPFSSETLDGCTVYTYNDGDLIACFDENVPESVVTAIARRKPLRAVFRDGCFASSPEKINVVEIFKNYAPTCAVKVL